MEIPELTILGLIFVLVGALLYKFPPKKMNSYYGYRTPSSMKSKEAWQFAQKFSATELMKSGVVMILVGIIIHLLNFSSNVQITILISSLFIFSTFIIIRVEMALKKK
jgi:uncharacterized membrane protein